MIKTTIIGGSTPVAGELIRILINHPDVDIRQVQSGSNVGCNVADVHTGLIGETDLKFSSTADVGKSDLVFVCDFSKVPNVDEDTRVICFFPPETDFEKYIYGLPEMNRKPMVRGARRAVIPSAQAMLVSLALLPLARNIMLKGDIDITIGLPSAITDYDVADELKRSLSALQNNLNVTFNISTIHIDSERVMTARCTLDNSVSIDELSRLYDDYFDDHNFTFRINRKPRAADVEGTNKCLICLERDHDNRLTISSSFDAVVKGNAGTAVHCMNLLFGLHELTGLALKASRLDWGTVE